MSPQTNDGVSGKSMVNVFGSKTRFEEFKEQAKLALDAATDEDGQIDIPGTTTKRVQVSTCLFFRSLSGIVFPATYHVQVGNAGEPRQCFWR